MLLLPVKVNRQLKSEDREPPWDWPKSWKGKKNWWKPEKRKTETLEQSWAGESTETKQRDARETTKLERLVDWAQSVRISTVLRRHQEAAVAAFNRNQTAGSDVSFHHSIRNHERRTRQMRPIYWFPAPRLPSRRFLSTRIFPDIFWEIKAINQLKSSRHQDVTESVKPKRPEKSRKMEACRWWLCLPVKPFSAHRNIQYKRITLSTRAGNSRCQWGLLGTFFLSPYF